MKKFAGFDVHRKQCTFVVEDESGSELSSGEIVTTGRGRSCRPLARFQFFAVVNKLLACPDAQLSGLLYKASACCLGKRRRSSSVILPMRQRPKSRFAR